MKYKQWLIAAYEVYPKSINIEKLKKKGIIKTIEHLLRHELWKGFSYSCDIKGLCNVSKQGDIA